MGELEDAIAEARADQQRQEDSDRQATARGEALIREFLDLVRPHGTDTYTYLVPQYETRTEKAGVFKSRRVQVKTGERTEERDTGGWIFQSAESPSSGDKDGGGSSGHDQVLLAPSGEFLVAGKSATPIFRDNNGNVSMQVGTHERGFYCSDLKKELYDKLVLRKKRTS